MNDNHETKKGRIGLKALRENANLTQAQLAHVIGTAEKTVRNWENDGAVPSFDKAIKLAKVFQVPLKRLAQEFDLDVHDIPNDFAASADDTSGDESDIGGDEDVDS